MNRIDYSFIGDKTYAEMKKQYAYVLARLMDELLYNMHEIGDDAPESKKWLSDYYRVADTQHIHIDIDKKKIPENIKKDEHHIDTHKYLREVQYYLEKIALLESTS